MSPMNAAHVTLRDTLSTLAARASVEGYPVLHLLLSEYEDRLLDVMVDGNGSVLQIRVEDYVKRLGGLLSKIHPDSGERAIVQEAIEALKGVQS